jgi:DNA-directed RNA polymerase specialized sigma24 family protein
MTAVSPVRLPRHYDAEVAPRPPVADVADVASGHSLAHVADVGGRPPVADVGELYREFSQQLEILVRGDVRACEAVIEDACHLAWTQLLRYRHRVARESVTRWLTITAVHEAVRMLRRHQRECSLELLLEDSEEEGPDLSSDLECQDVIAKRERLLDVQFLPRRQQRMLWLRALGFSYGEVASRERCSFRTVERQLSQARHQLRA